MTDAELRDALARMGIREQDLRAVLLLPLVEVAWSDGRMHDTERAVILKTARSYGLVASPAAEVLAGWLAAPPSAETRQLAHRVVVALSERFQGPTADLGAFVLDTVEAHCEAVAAAAGGLFGVAFTVGDAERKALREIREALRPGAPPAA
jgi:hypothetical protein